MPKYLLTIYLCYLWLPVFPQKKDTAILAEDKAGGIHATFEPRKYYGARLEPKNTILHGAGQDRDGFKNYVKAVGKNLSPYIYMNYTGIAIGAFIMKLWGFQLYNTLPKNTIPQIGITLTPGNDKGVGLDKEVAAGKHDNAIKAFAAVIKKIDRPCFVRIGYEFEGGWNNYKPESYRKAYIRIAEALRNSGANVALVWCSAGGSAGFKPIDQLLKYYPGDEWVDWWGIDLFDAREMTDKKLQLYLKAADSCAKPVMIGETTPRGVGVLKGQVSWEKWFVPFFNMLYSNPGVKAFCYINWDWAYQSKKLGFKWDKWGDARLEMNDTVRNAYIEELKKPIFEHSHPPEP